MEHSSRNNLSENQASNEAVSHQSQTYWHKIFLILVVLLPLLSFLPEPFRFFASVPILLGAFTLAGLWYGYRTQASLYHQLLRHPVFLMLMAYAIFSIISGSFARTPALAWSETIRFLLYPAVTLLTLVYSKQVKGFTVNLYRSILGLAFLNGLVGVALLLNQILKRGIVLGYTDSSFLNQILSLAVFTLPVALYQLKAENKKLRILALLAALGNLFLLAFYLYPPASIAAIVLLLVYILFPLNYYFSFQLNRRKILFALVLVLGVFAWSFMAFQASSRLMENDVFVTEKSWLLDYRFGKEVERIDRWDASLALYRDNRLLGVGGEHWRMEVASLGLNGIKGVNEQTDLQYPANEWAQLLAEKGFPGFLFLLALFLSIAYLPFRLINKVKTQGESNELLTLVAATFVFLIYTLLSDFAGLDSVLLLVSIYAALLLNKGNWISSGSKSGALLIALPVFIVLLQLAASLNFIGGSLKAYSQSQLRLAEQTACEGSWEKSLAYLSRSKSAWFLLSPEGNPLDWYLAQTYDALGRKDEELKSLLAAQSIHPNHVGVLNDLGRWYADTARFDTALAFFDQGLTVDSLQLDLLLNKTRLLFTLNQLYPAFQVLRKVPVHTSHAEYPAMRDTLLKAELSRTKMAVGSGELALTLERIGNDPTWMVDVYEKSLAENRSFYHQLVEESIYILEVLDRSISPQQAKIYRSQWLP